MEGREGEKERGVRKGQREGGRDGGREGRRKGRRDGGRKGNLREGMCEGGKQTRRKGVNFNLTTQDRAGGAGAVGPAMADQSDFDGNVGRASSHVSVWT